jgi:Tfp pilus assembly protein PilE
MTGTIAFIAAGTILSLTCARKIKHMAVSGQREEGLRFAKRVHRYFLGVLIMTWILGLLISVYMPVSYHAAQRSHTCNITAKSNLKNFYTAAEKYYQENPEGTIDMELAEQYGFKPTPGVKLEVRSGQRFNFTATASFQPPSEPYDPSGTKMYTINNHGEIVEQKMSDR